MSAPVRVLRQESPPRGAGLGPVLRQVGPPRLSGLGPVLRQGPRVQASASRSMQLRQLWVLGSQQLSTQGTRLRALESVRPSAVAPV